MRRFHCLFLKRAIRCILLVVLITVFILSWQRQVRAECLIGTVAVGVTPQEVAINQETNQIYVTNWGSNNVTVIDGATNATMTVDTGECPMAIAVNPVTNKIYVANYWGNSVTVIDGVTNETTTVPAGSHPFVVKVNSITNKIYVVNYENLTVIDGETNTTTTVNIGNPSSGTAGVIAVNSETNKIYVLISPDNDTGEEALTVIDGATNSTSTITGFYGCGVAVNPVTNKIYVSGGPYATVIDGATNAMKSIPIEVYGEWRALAVNSITNKIYMAGDSTSVVVIDGATNTTKTIDIGGTSREIAVNSINNKIYTTYGYSRYGTNIIIAKVIDGVTNIVTTIDVPDTSEILNNPSWANALAVNTRTNKIYVVNPVKDEIMIIEGTSEKQAKPDLLIKSNNETAYSGDNLYMTTPETATVNEQSILHDSNAIYQVKLQNDSNIQNSFILKTVEDSESGWQISYRLNGTDISNEIRSGGYVTPSLKLDDSIIINIVMVPDATVKMGSAKGAVIKAYFNNSDNIVMDSVEAKTTLNINYQPNLSIKASLDGEYDTYKATASVQSGQTVTYQTTLQNEGNQPDTFVISGPVGSGDWSIKYFDSDAGGNDITAQITGLGWRTSQLDVNAQIHLRIEVTLSSYGVSRLPNIIRLSAKSLSDPTKRDVVSAVTQVKRGHLWMKFEDFWPNVRRGRDNVVWIDYGNDGDDDIPIPLFNLSSMEGNAVMRLSPQEPYIPGPLQILGLATDNPITVLKPGASVRIPFYFLCPNEGGVHFQLQVVNPDTTPVDWAALEPELRIPDIDPTAWAVIWSNLQKQLGPNWSDFVGALIKDAQYLADNGHPCNDGREMCMIEVQKAADGFSPKNVLATGADTFPQLKTTGLGLGRVAPAGIAQRFRSGPFGRGWWHSYEYTLTRPETNEIQIEEPGGNKRVFSHYAGKGWVDSLGGYGQLTELADGRVQIKEKTGVVWMYNTSGQLESIKNPDGNQITLSYNNNLLTKITDPLNQTLTLTYDSNHRIIQLTETGGRTINYQYNSNGELIEVNYPDATSVGYGYIAPTGTATDYALNSITFIDGSHLYYTYDSAGRLAERTRDGGLEPVQYSYGDGGAVTTTDALENSTTSNFGAYGELLRIVDASGNEIKSVVNEAGETTTVTAPDGGITSYTYDTAGNIIAMTDPLGQTAQYDYTTDYAKLAWLKDGKGHQRKFSHDSNGNLTAITYPDSHSETFTHNSNGQVTGSTDRTGTSTTIEYDSLRRISKITYASGRTVTYTYDSHNNILFVVDSQTGTVTMTYDTQDRMTRIEYPQNRWLTFEYDSGGRRTKRTGYDGFIINYGYDAIGRLISLTDGNGKELIHYDYDTVGRVSKETKGNGNITSYTYTATGRVQRVDHTTADGTIQAYYEYTYDANGRPLTMTTQDGTTTYTYDAAGQLTGVTTPAGRTIQYAYDAAGNRRTVTNDGTAVTYQANAMDQYTQAGTAVYTYDINGNLTGKTEGTKTWSYTYDERNRLIRAATPDGVWTYEYDPLGNRTAVVKDGVRTEYVIDPGGLGDVAAEVDVASGAITHYVQGLGLVGRIDSTGNDSYYGCDGSGNVALLTGATGAIQNSYSYLPYGECTATTTLKNSFTYDGADGVMQDASGLYYMRVRSYDPGIGRFITPDPINIRGGLNLYQYARNNPISYADPSGLKGKTRAGGLFKEGIDNYLTGTGAAWADAWNTCDDAIGAIVPVSQLPKAYGKCLWIPAEEILTIGLTDIAIFWSDIEIYKACKEHPEYSVQARLGVSQMWASIGEMFEDSSEKLSDQGGKHNSPGPEFGTNPITSWDPNEIVGPAGYGASHVVPSTQPLSYTIYFENKNTATAPAEVVTVSEPLDANLNWSTVRLGEVAFGDQIVTDLSSSSDGHIRVAIKNSPYVLDISVVIESGKLTWTLTTIDPETGDLPADPMAGFLPPNDDSHRGEGHVTFSIMPKADLDGGTVISNKADIKFDENAIISTNTFTNVIGLIQPDASLRLVNEADYTGNDVYDDSEFISSTQTKSASTYLKRPAVFVLQVQNDGNAASATKVTGPYSGDGWTIKYFNAVTGGNDVTEDIATDGWNVTLDPGAAKEFRMEITPDHTVDTNTNKEVVVSMTDTGDAAKKDAVKAVVTAMESPAITQVVLNANPPSPRAANMPITLTAGATGGTDLQYKFLVNGQTVRSYSDQATFTWTPVMDGAYTLQAVAKDLNGTDPNLEVASSEVTYTISKSLSSVTLSASPTSSGALNDTVTLTATAIGGANVVYKFTANGQTIQDYTGDRTCQWKPGKAGTYQIAVTVKDLDGVDPAQEISSSPLKYTISTLKRLPTPSFSPDGGSFVSSKSVKITCTTSGVTIRYTTNGKDPVATDPVVGSTGIVTVKKSMTLKARAWKTGAMTSFVKNASYSVTVAAPTFSPASGIYPSYQSVAIKCATTGATIRYTTDGTDPTTASPIYKTPISVKADMTIKAAAWKSGCTTSAVTSVAYTINVVQKPVLSIATGKYAMAQNVIVTCATEGAEMHYTTDGTTPDAKDPLIVSGASVSVQYSKTLKVRAFKTGWGPSPVASAVYTITKVATPIFSLPDGTYNTYQSIKITCATPGVTIRYTTNGTNPTTASTAYTAPIAVKKNMTVKAAAWKSGCSTSAVTSAAYTINVVQKPVLSIPTGTYGSARNVTVTCATAGAEMHYTTDGTDPETDDPSVVSGGTIRVAYSMTLKVKAFMTDWGPSPIAGAAYVITKVATPVFTPDGGTYPTTQIVAITCVTPGATIRYTTDGSTPTITHGTVIKSGSTVTVDHTMTLKTVAYKTGLTASSVKSGSYTITAN